ncbi:uncharacterized protein LOC111134370 [Crassostrea virginica]|uniref:Uncharacterized protein LOC111134370 n=1 Tax=Crassostrea virginica TaxID=6565 RepID=A0A8B8EG35_CRAVI|nr:uncharacterized protein LOC111134370 [Crassostrea virginica]
MFTFSVFLVFLACGYVDSLSVKVLKPPPAKQGLEGALLIAPGAFIKGEAYEPLGLQIRESCDFRLWVVLLVDFFDNVVNPPQLEQAVSKARIALKDAGFQDTSPVFLAGHSLGGTMVSMYGRKPHNLSGVLLYAAYLTKGHALKDYPVPVMTLSGDLDGLTRITRILITFNELAEDEVSNPKAKYRTPVIVMEGVNHGQFASGEMPSNVATHDLPPDVTNMTAYSQIANYTCSFISNILRNDTESQQILDGGYRNTYNLLQPLMRVKDLDRNKYSTSQWTQTAQKTVIAVRNTSEVYVKSIAFDGQGGKFATSSPQTDVQSSALYVITYTEVTYPSDPFDVTLNPLSPLQIQAKMVSQERAKALLPDGEFGPGNITCKDINEQSILEAFHSSSGTARERYAKKGRQMFLDEDQSTSSQLVWLASQLQLREGSTGLHVRSVKYNTAYNPKHKDSSGLLFCSLLSPFRAMEWIYVDSLRPINS